MVIASREDAFALERAARAGIQTAVAPEQHQVLDALRASGAQIVVLAGYMRVLSPEIIDESQRQDNKHTPIPHTEILR